MMRTVSFVGLALLFGSGLAVSQQAAHTHTGSHTMVTPQELKWGPSPPGLPAGAEVAVLAGDPAVAGQPFTLRAKLPAGYRIPPHWHPTVEHVSVLDGVLMMGVGETFDEVRMKALPAGSFAAMPKETRHYVQTKGATTIQVHGTGPFGITYVNPADDPRKPTSN